MNPEDTVWIPAVPLPWMEVFADRCQCGKRFWSFDARKRRAAYELHWRREHEPPPERSFVNQEVTRSEAERIYAEVRAA